MTRMVVSGVVGLAIVAGGVLWLWRDDGPAAAARPLERPPTQVEVKRALSGHKIKLDTGEQIVYAGIRAPYPHEPLFAEAKFRNAQLVDGRKARLRFDATTHDRKDRALAYVTIDDVMVNEQLVREGLAFVRLDYQSHRFADLLLAAQSTARAERRGIWAFIEAASGELHGDSKYANFHRPECGEVPKIKSERHVVFASRNEAFDRGFAPCTTCRP